MFFQNKQYKALEVIRTGKSTVQAIVFCILWGKAAHGIQLLELASFIKEVDMLGFFAAGRNRSCGHVHKLGGLQGRIT